MFYSGHVLLEQSTSYVTRHLLRWSTFQNIEIPLAAMVTLSEETYSYPQTITTAWQLHERRHLTASVTLFLIKKVSHAICVEVTLRFQSPTCSIVFSRYDWCLARASTASNTWSRNKGIVKPIINKRSRPLYQQETNEIYRLEQLESVPYVIRN